MFSPHEKPQNFVSVSQSVVKRLMEHRYIFVLFFFQRREETIPKHYQTGMWHVYSIPLQILTT